MTQHTCPRRREVGRENDTMRDLWHNDRHCTWCGSISGDEFMRLVENDECKLTPTDKNYKVYVETAAPNPDQLEIRGTSNTEDPPSCGGDGEWVRREFIDTTKVNTRGWLLRDDTWYLIQKHGPRRNEKFYFQHLSEEQKDRFVQLMNTKSKLRMHYPGYFYVLPFFVKRDN